MQKKLRCIFEFAYKFKSFSLKKKQCEIAKNKWEEAEILVSKIIEIYLDLVSKSFLSKDNNNNLAFLFQFLLPFRFQFPFPISFINARL